MDALRLLSRSSGLKLNQSQQKKARAIPSAGHNAVDLVDGDSTSKKRKHEEIERHGNHTKLSEIEVRQVQKKHKIRITDLHAFHEQSSETRKTQKETSRLFPQPLQSFRQLRESDVNSALVANIAEQAYDEPTEVQLATIPLLLRFDVEEPDLLTIAPTGSGKTLAFLIPLINKISKSRNQDEEKHVSALILAPTKELVSQIVNEGRKLTTNTGVRITELRKGMKLHADIEAKEPESSEEDSNPETDTKSIIVKADILVSTPLSLLNAITSKISSTPLKLPQVQTLVLDEADVLLDPLFRDQTLAIWSSCTSPSLRTSLWSATIGSSIEELAISTLENHHSLNIPKSISKTHPPLLRTVIGLKDTSLPSINHKLVYASTESGKLLGLRQLIHPSSTSSSQPNSAPALRPPFLIFTQTIPRAQSLHKELQYDIPPSAGGSTRIAVLHSNLSTKQRTGTMASFRQGKIWILITTDLLSRGIDFRGVNGIVNYDIPTTSASYVHRAGRTGRAGRKGGIAVTFYTRDDIKYLKPIANIIAASEKKTKQDSASTTTTSSSSASTAATATTAEEGLPAWLIPSLPHLTKTSRKDLKTRGVDVRRAVKQSDTDSERKKKLKNRIGTSSGYERKLEDRQKGMKEGSRRRGKKAGEDDSNNLDDAGEWAGLED